MKLKLTYREILETMAHGFVIHQDTTKAAIVDEWRKYVAPWDLAWFLLSAAMGPMAMYLACIGRLNEKVLAEAP